MRRRPLFPPPKHPSTRKNLRNKGRQEYSVNTVNDRVVLQRIRWHGEGVGSSTPMDLYLDAAEQTLSVGAREIDCRLGVTGKNFDRAAENLARAAQIHVSGETLRTLMHVEGVKVVQMQKACTLPVNWQAADCIIADCVFADSPTADSPAAESPRADSPAAESPAADSEATGRIYLGSDGVMAPMVTDHEKQVRRQKIKDKRRRRGRRCKPLPRAKAGADQKYKEFKIVALYDQTQDYRLVAGTKGDCNEAGRLMRKVASAVRLDQADEKIGNVDGAPWIRNQIEQQSIPLDALGLDFYHLADNVHKARRLVYGEENAEGTAWAAEVLHAFKHEGFDAAWDRLTSWRAALRARAKRQAADALMTYVSERREMIRYPEFAAKGWQIGSGPTEACCKTMTSRLKGSGMRWDAANAEAVMALESLWQSGLWSQ